MVASLVGGAVELLRHPQSLSFGSRVSFYQDIFVFFLGMIPGWLAKQGVLSLIARDVQR